MIEAIIFILSTIGLIFSIDPHAHRCLECKKKWWHLGIVSGGDVHKPRAMKAHTCRCGTQQWERLRLMKGKCDG